MSEEMKFYKNHNWIYLNAAIFVSCVIYLLGVGSSSASQEADIEDSAEITSRQAVVPEVAGSLGELTNGLVVKMNDDLKESKLFFDRTGIIDVITTKTDPFAVYLANSLDVALSSAFSVVKDPVQADYILRVSYQRSGDTVLVFCKYFHVKQFVTKTVHQAVGVSGLPGDSFEENLRSKAYQLAAGIINEDVKKRLYLQPIREAVDGYVSEFSVTFGLLLKSEIARMHKELELVDEATSDLVMGQEAVTDRTAEDIELELINAVLAEADTILSGDYFVSGDKVILTLFIKDPEGRILNSVSEEISTGLISNALEDEDSRNLADYADKSSEGKDLVVKISSTKGGDNVVYHHKEKMVFYLQTAKPLYIYLYDIDPLGNVSRLFPNVAHQEKIIFQPGKLYIYPDGSDGVELEVNPPFGKDIVKVFASSAPLPLPDMDQTTSLLSYSGGTRAITVKRKEVQKELAVARTIHPKDLVDYYRGVAAKHKVDLYETSIYVETKE